MLPSAAPGAQLDAHPIVSQQYPLLIPAHPGQRQHHLQQVLPPPDGWWLFGRTPWAGCLLGRGCAVSELGASFSWVNTIWTSVCLEKVTQGGAEQVAGRGSKICDTDGLIFFSSGATCHLTPNGTFSSIEPVGTLAVFRADGNITGMECFA